MRRPNVAGLTLQALEPLVQKLTELEQQALRGDSMSVVTLGAALATTLSIVGRRAMELVIQQVHAQAHGDLRVPERSEGFGVIEVDGVHVLTWKAGQEPRRKATDEAKAPSAAPSAAPEAAVSETGERALRHQAPSTLSEVAGSPMGPTGRSPRVAGREVCMGLTYLGEHACEESPGRGVLLDRRYVATLNDRDGFWLKLHAAATAQGVLSRQKVVRVSDGGAYFIEHSDELFCDQPLLGILDCQHAKQHVWEAGHKVVADKKAVSSWVLPHTKAIMDGKVDQVISGLDQERKLSTGGQAVKALDDLTGYLTLLIQKVASPSGNGRHNRDGIPARFFWSAEAS
jgi:hypothetical protein